MLLSLNSKSNNNKEDIILTYSNMLYYSVNSYGYLL